jgi:hypothetical protein
LRVIRVVGSYRHLHADVRYASASDEVAALPRNGLYVSQDAPWFATLRSELLSFPAGKHDDQVDALGLIGQLLDTIMVGNKPDVPKNPQQDSGYRILSMDQGSLND